MKTYRQSQIVEAFRQSLENISRTYLHYRMCKFFTFRQAYSVLMSLWAFLYHSNKSCLYFQQSIQSTLCVSLWLSEALLPWTPLLFRYVHLRNRFRALSEISEKLRLGILTETPQHVQMCAVWDGPRRKSKPQKIEDVGTSDIGRMHPYTCT